jgi:hypothetical protein
VIASAVLKEEAMALGSRLLRPTADLDADEGHRTVADPAGRPFASDWGIPPELRSGAFVAERGRRSHYGRRRTPDADVTNSCE